MDQKEDSIKKIIIQFVIIMIITIAVMIIATPMIETLDAQLELTRRPPAGEWVGGP